MSVAFYAVIPFALATLLALFPFVAVGYRKLADRIRPLDTKPGPLPDATFRQFTEGAHPSDRLAELEATYAMPTREPRQ